MAIMRYTVYSAAGAEYYAKYNPQFTILLLKAGIFSPMTHPTQKLTRLGSGCGYLQTPSRLPQNLTPLSSAGV